KASDGELRPFERRVLDRLFAYGDDVTQDDMVGWARANQSEAVEFWDDFKRSVGDGVEGTYVEGGRAGVNLLNGLVAAVVIVVGIVGLLVQFAPHRVRWWAVGLAGEAIVLGVGQLVATRVLRRRTQLGARRA